LNVIEADRLLKSKTPEAAVPTMVDVLQTHSLFIKSTWKPFVSYAWEYTRIACAQAITAIPKAGESAHITFDLQKCNGDWLNDMVVHLTFPAIGAAGGSLRYKYCDFPGLRLFKSIRLWNNKEIVDEYSVEDVLFSVATKISYSKRVGFDTLVGQEQPIQGNQWDENLFIDRVLYFKEGAQTLQPLQPALDLWIPLMFDFNSEMTRSLFNRLINNPEFYIEIILESSEKIIQVTDADGTPLTGEAQNIRLPVSKITLYAKNIYLNPDVLDCFSARDNFALIRVHKQHTLTVTQNTGSILLNQLKYAVEMLNFGMRPNINTTGSNNFKTWYYMANTQLKAVPSPAVIPDAFGVFNTLAVRTALYF
jgi:hypothetical protein